MGHGWISWIVWSSLKEEKVFVDSGSASHPCPAHPSNISNDLDGTKNWKFNTAEDKGAQDDDLEEGGVLVSCSVHTHSIE